MFSSNSIQTLSAQHAQPVDLAHPLNWFSCPLEPILFDRRLSTPLIDTCQSFAQIKCLLLGARLSFQESLSGDSLILFLQDHVEWFKAGHFDAYRSVPRSSWLLREESSMWRKGVACSSQPSISQTLTGRLDLLNRSEMDSVDALHSAEIQVALRSDIRNSDSEY